MLDLKICQSITSLVEKLATSGKQEVEKKTFKELIGFAGQSEEYIKFCLERIFQQLEQKHCEIRYGAFLIIEELFRRSSYFREILLDDFPAFLELTVESDPSKLLPPPLNIAKKLKQRVLQAIQKWYCTFGVEHKRLALSYNFLKHNLKVDFQDALKRNANELNVERVEQDRQAKVIAKKVEGVQTEINENVDEISRIVTEMNNCFCLLVPKPEDLFENAESNVFRKNNEGSPTDAFNLREHGLQGLSSITIQIHDNVGKVRRTEDNSVIIDNLRDYYVLLKNRYLIMIKKWIQISSKAADQTLFRKVMDLKEMVQAEVSRFNELKLADSSNDNSSDSDSEFEDVPEKDGFEAEVISSPVVATFPGTEINRPGCSKQLRETESWKLWEEQKDDAKDPTSLSATLQNLKDKQSEEKRKKLTSSESTGSTKVASRQRSYEHRSGNTSIGSEEESRKQKLLKVAPKLPFDVDLYHWEDKDLKAPSIEIVETDGHKFWTPAMDREGETIEDPNGIASLRTRVIEFSGKFEPVKWTCRAPLPSGKLCPRKDRVKCPFHGKIIARNNMGNPTKPEDIAELEKEKERIEQEKPPDWQDPEFLKDLQGELGIDLTVKPSKKGKQKKKTFAELYPELTDIDKKKNTPRTRLEKKVFNKSAVKRVAETLDDISHKKFKDKFGDQWNYSMHNG